MLGVEKLNKEVYILTDTNKGKNKYTTHLFYHLIWMVIRLIIYLKYIIHSFRVLLFTLQKFLPKSSLLCDLLLTIFVFVNI